MLRLARHNTSLGGGSDFPRVVAVYDFWRWVRARNLTRPQRLLLLADDPEVELLQPASQVRFTYDAFAGTGDLHLLRADTLGRPDMVVLGQTLEHLYDPLLALVNLHAALAEGGHVFASVPCVNLPHMTPLHFRHFTPLGLASLLEAAGFELLELSFWGSREYEQRLFATGAWPGFSQLGNLLGDAGRVDQVWALARKPAAAPTPPSTLLPHTTRSACELHRLYAEVVLPGCLRRRAPPLHSAVPFPHAVALGDLAVWAQRLGRPRLLLSVGSRADPELEVLRPLDHVLEPGAASADMAVLGWGVLEGLQDPALALAGVAAALVDGGHIFAIARLVTAPGEGEYFHFTTMGLVLLLLDAGFKVLEVGQWGSKEYEAHLFSKDPKQTFERPRNPSGDFSHADVAWALGRKR